ncbi:inactive tyrosine-protein kinase PRAG1 isoform X2 [Colossoma macropomum]|uniref:inactive tyrosine-protein kinase PRAG1 isoform X2 n=1 Tax=Colossoma macropomum TaxID=42526 RepID=UPI00186480D4|nr:inactive tyrosine-protein kinase PRAG1 isoform X2 [Colossoma macropomum]
MSACGEFAEHVWKPGSCKNCFHPRSAHTQTETAGGVCRSVCARTSVGGDEEDGGTSPSPYSKPTIAVRPTMMNTDINETATHINMNSDQESQKSPVRLKKILDLAPLYIDSNGCSKALREVVLQNSISSKLDYPSRVSTSALSPTGFPKDSVITSSVFVTQEDGLNPHSLKENGNGDPYRPQVAKLSKSTYTGPQDLILHNQGQKKLSGSCDGVATLGSPVQDTQAPLGIVAITTVPGNGVNFVSKEMSSASSSPAATPDSRNVSLSDSCSYRSSTDSMSGTDVFHTCGPESPSSSGRANGQGDGEPIYAESTKRKRRPQVGAKPQPQVDAEVSSNVENQRTTITVMAAHTEENNRTFYLSSPDSAVSTQWLHFSPTTPDDPSSPTFNWPSSPATTETTSMTSTASVQTKPQSSPPIPPKRNSRSPKLGTSSLSPVTLPELSFHLTLVPKEVASKSPQVDALASTHLERRQKLHSNSRSLEGRIEEVEEECESEQGAAQKGVPHGGSSSSINGPAVWGSEAKEWNPAGKGEGNSTPGTDSNNSTSQKQAGVRAQEGTQCGSMLARASSNPAPLTTSLELASSGTAASTDPKPPPPPPKKHHRVCGKLSASSMELDRLSQQGSVESLPHSLRGIHSSTASTDSLQALSDSAGQDSTLRSCPSPFPSSPLASSPSSPRADPFPSNSLGRQLHPPPLPEKKLVNRTVSAPGDSGVRAVARARPRLPFGGSESNVSGGDAAGLQPSSPVEPRPVSSSSDLLDGSQRQAKGQGRLGGHSRGSVTSCSSPQLSSLAQSHGATHGTLSSTNPMGSTLHLHTLLSNMDSRECVYSKLGGLYAESLRRLALKCEEHFTRSQKDPLRFDESNWSLFKLTCNKASCLAGDAVYYSASCASDASNMYAVKICKGQTADAKQAHLYGLSVQQNIPPHFNLQQDCGHFIACVPQSMLPGEDPKASGPPEQERVVVITREVPRQSAADFVKEWASFHRAQPEVYERRVCFLLLQLCNGLEHLKTHGVIHRDLCLENLLLVPHRRPPQVPESPSSADPQQQHLPRLLISNFSKAKQRGGTGVEDSAPRDHARLAPEIVSAAQYRKFDEFQTGILIYELLHQPNPFEVTPALREQEYRAEDLPPIPAVSIYSAGLQRLARLLLQPDPIKRIHIQEAKRGLQSLLWGPRKELMEQQMGRPGIGGMSGIGTGSLEQPRHDGLLNWLDVKRALLMMKFAERSLEPERNAELEDWLCCQYFSTAHPMSLCHTAELLYSIKASH